MGELFRSEKMTLCQLFLQPESAYACLNELGELGLAQFNDLNTDVNAFQRHFVNEVRRCDEMERQIKFFTNEIKKDKIPLLDYDEEPTAPPAKEMGQIESTFEKLEKEVSEINRNTEDLKKTYLELSELRHILKKTQKFFEEQASQNEARKPSLLNAADPDAIRRFSLDPSGEFLQQPAHGADVGFIAGVVLRDKIAPFERMLWRVCRGNVFMRQVEIEEAFEDPKTGDQVRKSVFIIVYQGEQLKGRVKKICEGFRATLYPCPEHPSQRRDMLAGVVTRLDDMELVLKQSNEHRRRVLVAAAKNMTKWIVIVRKIKAIYHTLNSCNMDLSQKCLIAECWVPDRDLDKIQEALKNATDSSGSSVASFMSKMDTNETPPTYNRTNKFSSAFQNIIDAYGVANYQEANPTPFSIITFPYIFSIMFGDCGHGTCFVIFALWMIIWEKPLGAMKSKNEIWLTFFDGRYLIFLMGAFAMFSGMNYNDCFSKSVNIFGSRWFPNYDMLNETETTGRFYHQMTLNPVYTFKFFQPYPFGCDPIWQFSTNKIMFLNSLKMKLSVIVGVAQMVLGVILSLFNHVYFRNATNIFCEFIPQMIFMITVFCYMNFMVVYKWFMYDARQSAAAPSLLILLINMFMLKQPRPKDPPSIQYMYDSQALVQYIFVGLAVISIPWMLLIKPFILQSQYKKKMKNVEKIPDGNIEMKENHGKSDEVKLDLEGTGEHGGAHGGHEEEEFELGEALIHQAIHTIEYCLGSISHTASYLRLWALSLAHMELSEVLWHMVMRIGFIPFDSGKWEPMSLVGGLVMYGIFAFWVFLTISILLLMEGLSAFLHTLRLHWVEFMSKFYGGVGIMFIPYSFKLVLAQSEDIL